jgi:hypothetical protein
MKNSPTLVLAVIVLGLMAAAFAQSVPRAVNASPAVTAAAAGTNPTAPYRIGEKLSYNVSFGKITDAAYAEIFVVSRGKLAGRDAIEIQARFKTMNLVSAFYLLDESRLTYAAAETGTPLYTKVTSNEGVLPRETARNFLEAPNAYHDLLTAIYQARALNGGTGTFSFQEDDKIYSVTLQASGSAERVRTDAGEYDTRVSTVQSSFLDEIGLKDVRINFSNDESRLPVLIRFKTYKGEFSAALASAQIILPDSQTEQTPTLTTTPAPSPTPVPFGSPRPNASPTPYIENQPLSEELPFALGETMNFKITSQNQTVGTIAVQAKERRRYRGQDALMLSAVVTNAGPQGGVLNVGDSIKSHVDPLSLTPISLEIKLAGAFAPYNQSVQFDQTLGRASDNTTASYNIPVGTHNILSLAYAMRSFNLTQTKPQTSSDRDTRVAVFWKDRNYVLSLRPQNTETLEFEGRKVTAQVVTFTADNPQFNQFGVKVWFSADGRRLPLRVTIGGYRADLLSVMQAPVNKPEIP